MQVYDIPIGKTKKEETIHGSYEFPMEIYETNLSKNVLGFVNWHWHDELQFCLVTKGQVCFSVNSMHYTLSKGEGIYINKGALHMAKPLSGNDSTYICLDADAKLFSSFTGSIVEIKYVNPFIESADVSAVILKNDEDWQKKILGKLKKIHRIYINREEGYEIEVFYELMSIWKHLSVNTPADTIRNSLKLNSDYAKMKEIMAFIHQNYNRKINLEMISEKVHLSRNECCRFFKRMANTTIFDYLIDYRINKALELLHFSNMNISRIAYETGFGSSSFFIETFKKKTASTPKEYRQIHVKEYNTCGDDLR